MHLECGVDSLRIVPDNEVDEAYLQHTFGLHTNGDFVKFRRRNHLNKRLKCVELTRDGKEKPDAEAVQD